MIQLILIAVLALLPGVDTRVEAQLTGRPQQPSANPQAEVVVGNARFTVLTPALVRMEWANEQNFENRASLVIINRLLAVPKFDVQREGGAGITITTDDLIIKYQQDGKPFSADNLSVTLRKGSVTWKPGTPDTGNLRGTTRTLDGVSGSCPLEPGLLSRDGWALVDDSRTPLIDAATHGWAVARPDLAALDWYFFGYGRNYTQALFDYTQIAGRIPLPPRYVFGAWWSRYWAYSDAELRDLVGQFKQHDVPLDVLVVDMDWHLDGWTGYTWNPKYFPDPAGFLKWCREQGLRVTLNLHPADGVGKHEAAFPEMAKALGLDPATTERIPFDSTDRKFVDAYFQYLHHPLQKMGVDFWWMDWQQGFETAIKGLDPLRWLNHLHWSDQQRNPGPDDRRPLIFSRWGGLGNHRWQIGFSGDTFCNWESLAFQPYFTATAGNVGYAYWSHDIGGHQPGVVDPELYTRWIQFGALSPALRTHTTKNPDAERRIWAFPKESFDASRAAFKLRYSLLPYIYTAARQCYDTALPICRPMYYAWPDADEAYQFTGQYMLGDQLLVAPVSEARSKQTGTVSKEVWLPPGKWTHWFTGRTYSGPAVANVYTPLEEIPLFAREGAIIPAAPPMNRTAERPLDPLVLNIFPGEEGQHRLYEDDGLSNAYERDGFSRMHIAQRTSGGVSTVSITPPAGQFAGMLAERGYQLRWRELGLPRKVVWNGQEVQRSNPSPNPLPQGERASITPSPSKGEGRGEGEGDSAAPHWWYDTDELSLVVELPRRPAKERQTVRVEYDATRAEAPFRDGLHGFLNRARRMAEELGEAAPAEVKAIAATRGGIAANETGAHGASEELQRRWLSAAEALTQSGDTDVPPQNQTSPLWSQIKESQLSDAGEEDRRLRVSRWLGLVANFAFVDKPVLASASQPQFKEAIFASAQLRLAADLPATHEGLSVRFGSGEGGIFGRNPQLQSQPIIEDFRLFGINPDPCVIRISVSLSRQSQTHEPLVSFPLSVTARPSIETWHVVGPFVGAYDKLAEQECGPERQSDLVAEYPGGERAVRWRRLDRPLPSQAGRLADEYFVDLAGHFGGFSQEGAAYALAYLNFVERKNAQDDLLKHFDFDGRANEPAPHLTFGADDGVIVWVNGEEVFRDLKKRRYQSKQFRVPIKVKPGLNTILLKVLQSGGGWGFAAHLTGPDGEPLPPEYYQLLSQPPAATQAKP